MFHPDVIPQEKRKNYGPSDAKKYFDIDDSTKSCVCKLCQAKISADNRVMRGHLRYKHTDIFMTLKRQIRGPIEKQMQPTKLIQYYEEVPENPAKRICKLCNKSVTRDNIRRHIQNKHGIFAEGDNPKQWLCTHCGKVFKDKWSRNHHEDTVHKKIFKHMCSICGKGCANKHILNDHMLKHTGEKPYQCADCGTQFTNSGVFNQHVQKKMCKMENGATITSLTCLSCKKEFSSVTKMKLHYLRSALCTYDNNKKPFPCQLCEKSFMTEKYLEVHMRSHSGKRNKL